MVEEKLTELLLSQLHFYLLLGIISIIYFLRQVGPINVFLFSDKWRWLVGVLNIAMSFVGVFVLNLTEVQGIGPKAMIALIISAFSTFAYELVFKHIEQFLRNKFQNTPSTPTQCFLA
jgi:hypothetical protein